MLSHVCSLGIDHRSQNVVKISVTHLANGECTTFLFLSHFDVICDLDYSTDVQKHGIFCAAVYDIISITYCSGYIYPLHGFYNSIII